MDSDEAPRIQTLLQLREGVLNRMIAAAGHGKGQLVLREEMGDAPDLEDRRALADARGNPFQPSAWACPERSRGACPELRGKLARKRADVGPRLSREPRQLVERPLE